MNTQKLVEVIQAFLEGKAEVASDLAGNLTFEELRLLRSNLHKLSGALVWFEELRVPPLDHLTPDRTLQEAGY